MQANDIAAERYTDWRLRGLSEEMDEREIYDSFASELEFGTGGLRGIIGAGTNRMNIQTVTRASLGLSDYLKEKFKHPSVAIAYDTRFLSREFAEAAASVLTSKGVEAYIFSSVCPTPVLSYTVRRLSLSAGIVITASHNPKEYNGYKVYNEKGCQITDSVAYDIYSKISNYGYFNSTDGEPSLLHTLDDSVFDGYIDAVIKGRVRNCDEFIPPRVVYTPLNGTGLVPATRLFGKLGITNVITVKEQEKPNCEFTTCPYPNPEEQGAMLLALSYADKYDTDLIFATDPDADRVGVAEKLDSGEIISYTGNEAALILLDYILKCKRSIGELGENSTVIKTIVTSPLAETIALRSGVTVKNVLTGFKYIGEQIDLLNETSDFVFGFEESCGYLIGDHARDKDSFCAMMLICDAWSYHKRRGMSLWDALNEIYKEYGYQSTLLKAIKFEGADGIRIKESILCALRAFPPKNIAGANILEHIDYSSGIKGLPRSNVLEFSGKGFKILVRPSGTEPKLKMYFFANGETLMESKKLLNALTGDFDLIIEKLANNKE